MWGEGGGGAGGEGFGGGGIECVGDGGGEFAEALGAEACAGLGEAGGEGLEVFHVWSADDGDGCGDGFAGVLSTEGEEGFADDDGGGVGSPVAEFAGGVDDEDLGFLGGGGWGEVGAESDLVAVVLELVADFGSALGVAGDDGWEGVGGGGGDGAGDGEFFAIVGGGGEDDGAVGAEGVEDGLEFGAWGGRWAAAGVDFEAAGVVDVLGGDAEVLPDLAVLFVLEGDGVEACEVGFEPVGEAEVAACGAGGEAGVDEGDGDVAFLAGEEEVWPGFAFDEDDLGGLEAVEVALEHGWEVEGGVGDAEVGEVGGAGDGVAGGGAGGEEEGLVWGVDTPLADEFEGEE